MTSPSHQSFCSTRTIFNPGENAPLKRAAAESTTAAVCACISSLELPYSSHLRLSFTTNSSRYLGRSSGHGNPVVHRVHSDWPDSEWKPNSHRSHLCLPSTAEKYPASQSSQLVCPV